MYIYITTQLNQGYKVGIAEDIDQRQQQYTTLIPNIGFHAAVQTGHAETIEKSFKHRFQDYRALNLNSSKVMKSEVYEVKLKYLLMHLAHCMHRFCKAFIIEDNPKAFSKNELLKNKINLYLSNYYFFEKKSKFIQFSITKPENTLIKIKVGEIEGSHANFDKKGNFKNHEIKLVYIDPNKKGFQNCVNLLSENYGHTSQNAFDREIDKLNLNKKEETFKGFFIWKNDYMSPYKLALHWMSRKWFVDLINFDYLRQYNYKLLEEEGVYRGTTKHLKLFHYPYPKKFKMKFPEREKIDSLLE
tara:strand:+ start:1076 stop:1978 length:903 start_codon:yes stop_codon:yes gene_type:complete